MDFAKSLRRAHLIFSYFYGRLAFGLSSFLSVPPSKMHFLVTSRCNLKCHFCYCKDNLNMPEPNIIDQESWKKIAKNISPLTATIFTGGEAFLYPHIYTALQEMFIAKRMVSITTNGMSINCDKLFSIHSKNIFVMMFSIHGTREVHDRITGVKGSYDKAMSNISKISNYKKANNLQYPILSVKTVLCEDNLSTINDFVKEIAKAPVKHLYFNLLAYDTLHHSLELYDELEYKKLGKRPYYEYPEEQKQYIYNLINHLRGTQYPIDIGFTDIFKNWDELCAYIENPKEFKVSACYRPWHELLVYSNGDYGNCLGMVAGNIKDQNYNFSKLFRAKKYKKFLSFFKSKKKSLEACYGCKEAAFSRAS